MAAERRLAQGDEEALRNMLDFARIAVRLRHETKRHQLDERTERRLAIERLIELVGEAAKRVSTRKREELAHIPWPGITGTREKLAHDYDRIDPDILWDTKPSTAFSSRFGGSP
jgi:uncharacterized protein with HEPN domain